MASALENISKAAELAGQRLKQLEHEKIVLDQKKEVCPWWHDIRLKVAIIDQSPLFFLSKRPKVTSISNNIF
jgi:hypothetical protein